MTGRRLNTLVKRFFGVVGCVAVFMGALCIPINAEFGYYTYITDNQLQFRPQINLKEAALNESLLLPTLSHIDGDGESQSSFDDFYVTGNSSSTATEGYVQGTYRYEYINSIQQNTDTYKVMTRALINTNYGSSSGSASYDINMYQDTIILPFGNGAKYAPINNFAPTDEWNQQFENYWEQFVISFQTNTANPDLTVTNRTTTYSFDVCIPNYITARADTNTGTKVKLKGGLTKLFTHSFTSTDWKISPFGSNLYDSLRTILGEYNVQYDYIVIKNFKSHTKLQMTGSTPSKRVVYVLTEQVYGLNTSWTSSGGVSYLDTYTFLDLTIEDVFSEYNEWFEGFIGIESNIVDWITGLGAFFDTPIFGSFSIGDCLWFIVGFSLLIIFLKMFAGG